MKVELKVREGGVVSPAKRQLLSTLWQALSTMSLYCVKVSPKIRTDAALTPIYARTFSHCSIRLILTLICQIFSTIIFIITKFRTIVIGVTAILAIIADIF